MRWLRWEIARLKITLPLYPMSGHTILPHAPIYLSPKGVLSPQDAVAAVDAGADGIIVSNHGGRALDGALSSIESLGPIVEVRLAYWRQVLRSTYSKNVKEKESYSVVKIFLSMTLSRGLVV